MSILHAFGELDQLVLNREMLAVATTGAIGLVIAAVIEARSTADGFAAEISAAKERAASSPPLLSSDWMTVIGQLERELKVSAATAKEQAAAATTAAAKGRAVAAATAAIGGSAEAAASGRGNAAAEAATAAVLASRAQEKAAKAHAMIEVAARRIKSIDVISRADATLAEANQAKAEAEEAAATARAEAADAAAATESSATTQKPTALAEV
eukprot:gnl/MRDRNA2_/MRDRNA2_18018_c0_seq2.p1 gnl/MRDRNA2_/MRDRNA2_18018_c0~~gnl/MRDRNA2_/MRDRNA2_18018_c0_seq2.p1  ORF type:complete len:212 (+),score=68.13 gnl/MRDRNA2_/MRDRNA2_18018_c0_seq2:107-742(+)